ncbi:hypothetical protein Leryth_012055 [Lithospermum erythrorhizon]|nr:hypothetical protein Leryth_012055 [Lithospermum erythrorhizon]
MSLEETVKDVKQQLMEAGEKLLTPPSGTDELLSLLDLVDNALGKVEQSPGKAMHDALTSLRKALVSDELLGHLDTDVKVFVASCISEITRITAPDAPYDDEDMKRVFQLIVSSFEDLSDQSSRSYNKRVSILETVAKVRSCVIMLDLECDDLISEMFQIFFRTIRDYHPDCIFISMEIIMNLVLEESEEVSTDLITTLLSSVKRDDEEVPPIARRLGERILGTSAAKLKPYLIQATKNSDISLHNYSQILTSVCEGTVGRDALVQQPSDGCKATEASIDGTQEGGGCKVAAASVEPTQENDGDNVAVASSEDTQVGDLTKASAASSEETLEDAKDVRRDSLGDNSHTARRSPKTTMNNGTNVASKEKTSINGESSLKGDNCETTMNNGTNVASKEKTSINRELSLKGDNCETDNKSTNDEAIPKPESHALGVEEEAKVPDNLDSHEKDTVSSLDEDICPEPKNVESDKEIADVEARNGFKDSNAASPSPSAEKDDENLLKRDGHQLGKDCPTQGDLSSPGRITEKESERASDSEEASGESPDKKAHQESPLKDETSFEVATPKHEDSGTSDSEDKPIKEPTKKLDLRDSDDDVS